MMVRRILMSLKLPFLRASGTNSAFYKMVITPEIAIAMPWNSSALQLLLMLVSLGDLRVHWFHQTGNLGYRSCTGHIRDGH